MSAITTAQGREYLRLDNNSNDDIISDLLEGIEEYITLTTGLTPEQQTESALAKTCTKVLLSLWYDPQQAECDKLQKQVDNLLKAITDIVNAGS